MGKCRHTFYLSVSSVQTKKSLRSFYLYNEFQLNVRTSCSVFVHINSWIPWISVYLKKSWKYLIMVIHWALENYFWLFNLWIRMKLNKKNVNWIFKNALKYFGLCLIGWNCEMMSIHWTCKRANFQVASQRIDYQCFLWGRAERFSWSVEWGFICCIESGLSLWAEELGILLSMGRACHDGW